MVYSAKRQKRAFFAQSRSCHYNGPGIICFLATWYSALIATSITSAKLKNGILVYMVASVATFCSRQFFLLGQTLLLYSSVQWWLGASFWTKCKRCEKYFPQDTSQGVRNQVSCNMRNKTWTFSFLCRFCLSSPPHLPPIPFSYRPMEKSCISGGKNLTEIFLQQKLHLQTLFESALLAEPAKGNTVYLCLLCFLLISAVHGPLAE